MDAFEEAHADSDLGLQDVPDFHRCYNGPHVYPWATVLYLSEDKFLKPSADSLPSVWVPTHTRPAADLIDAFCKMDECWQQVPYELLIDDDGIADAVQVTGEPPRQS